MTCFSLTQLSAFTHLFTRDAHRKVIIPPDEFTEMTIGQPTTASTNSATLMLTMPQASWPGVQLPPPCPRTPIASTWKYLASFDNRQHLIIAPPSTHLGRYQHSWRPATRPFFIVHSYLRLHATSGRQGPPPQADRHRRGGAETAPPRMWP